MSTILRLTVQKGQYCAPLDLSDCRFLYVIDNDSYWQNSSLQNKQLPQKRFDGELLEILNTTFKTRIFWREALWVISKLNELWEFINET